MKKCPMPSSSSIAFFISPWNHLRWTPFLAASRCFNNSMATFFITSPSLTKRFILFDPLENSAAFRAEQLQGLALAVCNSQRRLHSNPFVQIRQRICCSRPHKLPRGRKARHGLTRILTHQSSPPKTTASGASHPSFVCDRRLFVSSACNQSPPACMA